MYDTGKRVSPKYFVDYSRALNSVPSFPFGLWVSGFRFRIVDNVMDKGRKGGLQLERQCTTPNPEPDCYTDNSTILNLKPETLNSTLTRDLSKMVRETAGRIRSESSKYSGLSPRLQTGFQVSGSGLSIRPLSMTLSLQADHS